MVEIIIVNEKDEEIGLKERDTVKQEDIYRVSALWIKNSKGESLIARRGLTKKNNPGKWGPAVAGTVEKGETYEENIKKEAKEELGLENVKFVKGPKTRAYGKHNHFTQWFILKTEKPIEEFKIQKEEIEEIKWISKKELFNQIDSHPEFFLKTMKERAELFC
jgi:isopentenyl-diphosphate delta-isomerase